MAGIAEPLDVTIPGQLLGFGPAFMAHAPAAAAPLLAPLTRQARVGAVVCTPAAAAARAAIRHIRRANPVASVLADAGQYRGNGRRIGADGMSTDWLNLQFAAGCPWALSNSGYIPAGNTAALTGVLARGADADRVIVALPLALAWLTEAREQLISAISTTTAPVALMLESTKDPLASDAAVAGLIDILRIDTEVLLLRSDISTLGALAHGAAAVSVGTAAKLRHIFPIVEDGGFGRTPPVSAFVPELLAYKHLRVISDGHTRDPESDLWQCGCIVCAGRTLDWIATAVDDHAAAFEHSVAALAHTARMLMDQPDPAAHWKTMCALAQLRHDDLPALPGKRSRYPAAQRAWVHSTPQAQGVRP
jgi:hypothetical protein